MFSCWRDWNAIYVCVIDMYIYINNVPEYFPVSILHKYFQTIYNWNICYSSDNVISFQYCYSYTGFLFSCTFVYDILPGQDVQGWMPQAEGCCQCLASAMELYGLIKRTPLHHLLYKTAGKSCLVVSILCHITVVIHWDFWLQLLPHLLLYWVHAKSS